MSLIFDPPVGPDDLAGRRVTIVGLGKGRTTAGLARYLVGLGARVIVTDAKPAAQLEEGIGRLGDLPVELRLGPSSDDAALADPDFVFVIPGVRPRSPTIMRALQSDIPVLTELGLFFRLCPAPIVGVTGTKGKTTTTTLIGEILARGTRRVLVGGNIGTAIIQELPSLTRDDIVVLELSSFQLETLGRSPAVAVVTIVDEDHLDHHGTREAYVAAKRNVLAWQGPRDVAVLNLDDAVVVAMHTGVPSEVRGYSLSLRPRRGAHLDAGGALALLEGDRRRILCDAAELRIPGRHNVGNALAAAVVGDVFDIPAEGIGRALREFKGVAHRLEPVGEEGGVLWVDDSQATAPVATLAALAAYGRPAVAILGGMGKGSDFAPLARELVARARGVVLIGSSAEEIAGAIVRAQRNGRPLIVERAETLREAVTRAKAIAHPGDVVLLSPACASFDMFASYEDRGDQFRSLVREFAR
ncbi:MAG: UDP-N-acetylmuramoyl-L-alanine--D-glutamate ligase [Chloroflexota bacterium]|nr:UDP-N-acetylmuramoyl-L-alanine--D-glutamate ligase [Chloroflexota bacterium]